MIRGTKTMASKTCTQAELGGKQRTDSLSVTDEWEILSGDGEDDLLLEDVVDYDTQARTLVDVAGRVSPIVIEHEAGIYAEIHRRPEDIADHSKSGASAEALAAGLWDGVYVDVEDGKRRDAVTYCSDSPQEVFDSLADHIEEVVAEKREAEAQEEEAHEVDWPGRIGRFEPVPHGKRTPHEVDYSVRYLHSYDILGTHYRTHTVQVRYYAEQQQYVVSDNQLFKEGLKRKSEVIEFLEEKLSEYSERVNRIENRVAENNDLPEYAKPEQYR